MAFFIGTVQREFLQKRINLLKVAIYRNAVKVNEINTIEYGNEVC